MEQIKLIPYGTDAWKEMVALRDEVLRRPLGLVFTEGDLNREAYDLMIGAYEDDQLIGCCILTPADVQTVQLRQMAVKPEQQSKGLGRRIVAFSEELARSRGYRRLILHARDGAVPFYEKCGYEVVGEAFVEVTIPHRHMEKAL
jgi:predicted N-acetyltransferase YhbS